MSDWAAVRTRVGEDGVTRCAWAVPGHPDPALLAYHDDEWGRPGRGPAAVFEALSLGVFQAGLGWLTVLRKREAFRSAFLDFEPSAVAAMGLGAADDLLAHPGIIRNRSKIVATIHNATVIVRGGIDLEEVAAEHRDPARPRIADHVPSQSVESADLSAVLKSLAVRFVGPTSVYAFMQSIGTVNDHVAGCHHGDRIDLEPVRSVQEPA